TQGYYGPGTGKTFADVFMPEPPEGTPEPPFSFVIPATSYDVVEPDTSAAQFISDYVDHTEISGNFISSDNPADYDPALLRDGIRFEHGPASDPLYGGDAH